ncbi:MarR family winged helix-turn-helix transcriptional regulator [Paenibacillus marinisediminis]
MAENDQMVELPLLFKKLIKKMTQEWKRRIPEDLSMSQHRMLYELSQRGPMKATEMAELLTVTAGAITGMTDKLVEYGWVERNRSEEDRRIVLLQLTSEGEKLIDSLKTRQRETALAFIDFLPPEDSAHLQRIFTRMLDEIENTKEE